MKTLSTLISICYSIIVFSQSSKDIDKIIIEGSTKFVASWQSKEIGDIKFKLSCGDEIIVYTRQYNIYVGAIHNKINRNLIEIPIEEIDYEDIYIEIHEYDWDKDGIKELLFAYTNSNELSQLEIFRYSSGLAEKVGNFYMQERIFINDNALSIPIGSQGVSLEYVYLNGNFYELVYHNPNETDNSEEN